MKLPPSPSAAPSLQGEPIGSMMLLPSVLPFFTSAASRSDPSRHRDRGSTTPCTVRHSDRSSTWDGCVSLEGRPNDEEREKQSQYWTCHEATTAASTSTAMRSCRWCRSAGLPGSARLGFFL